MRERTDLNHGIHGTHGNEDKLKLGFFPCVPCVLWLLPLILKLALVHRFAIAIGRTQVLLIAGPSLAHHRRASVDYAGAFVASHGHHCQPLKPTDKWLFVTYTTKHSFLAIEPAKP